MDGEEPTQATQNVLDPRRVGKQNSGFTDEDVSDIICVLYPHSETARAELQHLVDDDSPHIIGKNEADVVEPDYIAEDHASRFQANPVHQGDYAIILRLSAQLTNPAAGFAFGRNAARCDIVLIHDPLRRVSNIHFRIYVNEHGVVMIEDQSTNGTFVDGRLLSSQPKSKDRAEPPVVRWVLSSGSIIRIYLHEKLKDLTFRVRIPHRDEEYHQAYIDKVDEFFTRHSLRNRNETIVPSPGGHVDLFRTPGHPTGRRLEVTPAPATELHRSPSKRREPPHTLRREWTGSGKYNKVSMIGKGAFAVVHKVTSKYDGNPYAAKELEKRRFVKNGVLDQKVENEMKIMERINHRHIVRYIETFEWDARLLIIIMEYVPFGDLGKYIADERVFGEDLTRVMAKQLLSALGYLHENNITHRDVKPDNILINELDPLELKLTDFGLSKIVDTEDTFLRTFCGTLLYCAPEVYTEYVEYDDDGVRSRGKKVRRVPGQRYSHAVDIWSLGGVLFYAMTGSPPYPVKGGISYSELLHKIMTSRLDITPLQNQGISGQGVDFLTRMLQRRPEHRATVVDLNGHSWLESAIEHSVEDIVEDIVEDSQSLDEVTDDEGVAGNPPRYRPPPHYEEDKVSDSMEEESEKENYTFRQGIQPPRLFGEIGPSAMGSSGALPDNFLNLTPGNPSMAETEILGQQMDEAYESEDSTPKAVNRRAYRYNTASIAQQQSADQLQSLVEDVASQSLGGNGTFIKQLESSRYSMSSAMDLNTSKRKPPSYDTSDEFDASTPTGKPTMKRLKSEGTVENLADEVVEEYKLLATMPQIRRLGSGRQIDEPVDKVSFWEQSRSTWHLNYPEMTQLQHDAFSQAARDRNEDFGPGKSPLWDLAMKYFPPTARAGEQDAHDPSHPRSALTRDDRQLTDDTLDIPSTAAPLDAGSTPESLPLDTQIIIPVQQDTGSSQAIGLLKSDAESCIQSIEIPITDSMVSFGRGHENTRVFMPRTDARVPKCAFKIMLWKDGGGYDPAKDPAKVPHPWLRKAPADVDAYSVWICTKATLGIRINGFLLASSDCKNPNSPARYWTKIYNGDSMVVWSGTDAMKPLKINFQCFWGASEKPRGDNLALKLASASTAQKLDSACLKAEKRIRDVAEKRNRENEAFADQRERLRYVEQERERSRVFELKRREAVHYLLSRPNHRGSRRSSPASASPSVRSSRMHAGILPRTSPDNDTRLSAH